MAIILSGRYSVITSLSANDVGLINSDVELSEEKNYEADKTFEFIKLYMLKNSKGILTDDVDSVKAIEVICSTENTHNKFISCAQDVSGLIQNYRKTLYEVFVKL